MKFVKIIKRIKDEVVTGILAISMVITPLFYMVKQNKNKDKENTNDKIDAQIETQVEVIDKENVEVIDKKNAVLVEDVESIYNFDLSGLVLPDATNNNVVCKNVYDFDVNDTKSLYDMASELVEQIKENSLNYLNEHPEFVSAFLDKADDEYRYDKIATQTILRDTISDILKSCTNKDICLINDLRVVISYAETTDMEDNFVCYSIADNLLVVYPNNIRDSLEGVNGFWDVLEYSIQCELNTLRLQNCNCQKENNDFPYMTISKAAAKSELYNSGKIETLVSNLESKSESLILALGLFHDNLTIEDYYKAVFNRDIQALYEFCGVSNSEDDIYKLNKILYTIDVINGNNSLEIDTGTNSIEEVVGYDYRADTFGMVINNMMAYTSQHEDFKLKDNLIVFNIVKNLIVADVEMVKDDDALENIVTLNNIYINFLSEHYGTSVSKINGMETSEEIINYAWALINICNSEKGANDADIAYTLYSYEIFERFPLLKQILVTYDLTPLDYQNFVNSYLNLASYNKDILIKKRVKEEIG